MRYCAAWNVPFAPIAADRHFVMDVATMHCVTWSLMLACCLDSLDDSIHYKYRDNLLVQISALLMNQSPIIFMTWFYELSSILPST